MFEYETETHIVKILEFMHAYKSTFQNFLSVSTLSHIQCNAVNCNLSSWQIYHEILFFNVMNLRRNVGEHQKNGFSKILKGAEYMPKRVKTLN